MAKQASENQRIRIKLRAYDNKIIDKSAQQIVETIDRYGGKPVGPVPLPTEIRKFTVNRSSFIALLHYQLELARRRGHRNQNVI